MELSELVTYNGKIYTVDDRTGIVFEIAGGQAVPWVILGDGNGRESGGISLLTNLNCRIDFHLMLIGFKGEWMTVKNDKLYVGGHGKESIARDGITVLNKNYQWVKIITKEVNMLRIVNINCNMNDHDQARMILRCVVNKHLHGYRPAIQ